MPSAFSLLMKWVPQEVPRTVQSLNGSWDFITDPEGQGTPGEWFKHLPGSASKVILWRGRPNGCITVLGIDFLSVNF